MRGKSSSKTDRSSVAAVSVLVLTGILRVLAGAGRPAVHHDVLHVVWGAALAFLIQRVLEKRACLAANHRWVVAVAFTAVVGVLLEIIQPVWGLDRDPWDAVASGAGALAAWLWSGVRHGASRIRAIACLAACACALIIGLARPMLLIYGRHCQRKMFPLLASFEHPVELSFCSARGASLSLDRQRAVHGSSSLRVAVREAVSYPGITLGLSGLSWRGYRKLLFSVWVDSNASPQAIELRMDDRMSPPFADRYQSSRPLALGWNRIEVDIEKDLRTPQGRPLDTRHVNAIVFFLETAAPGMSFCLDDIRLAP